jgi:hypothetical protein
MRIAGASFAPPTLTREVLVASVDAPKPTRAGRCPSDMALVAGRVCVDRWEASLAERLPDGTDRAWSPFLPVDGAESRVRALSRPGVLPQAYISGRQAALACFAGGKRLCHAPEWEQACRGPADTQFPYGNERRAHVCNDDVRSAHPVPEVGRLLDTPSAELWRTGMSEPLLNQLDGTLLPTGARAECTNGYGVYDMVGNLHEWVDDGGAGYASRHPGADEATSAKHGMFRGGYYMDTTKNGDGCSYATTAHDFAYHDYSTGFRCCAEPAALEAAP